MDINKELDKVLLGIVPGITDLNLESFKKKKPYQTIIVAILSTTNLFAIEIAEYMGINHATVTYHNKKHGEYMEFPKENKTYSDMFIIMSSNFSNLATRIKDIPKRPNGFAKVPNRIPRGKGVGAISKVKQEMASLKPNRYMRIFYLLDNGVDKYQISKSCLLGEGTLNEIKKNREQIIKNKYKYEN